MYFLNFTLKPEYNINWQVLNISLASSVNNNCNIKFWPLLLVNFLSILELLFSVQIIGLWTRFFFLTSRYIQLLNPHSGYVKTDAYLLHILCHMTSDVIFSHMLFFSY